MKKQKFAGLFLLGTIGILMVSCGKLGGRSWAAS